MYKAIGVFVFALAVFVGVRWLGVDHAHGPVPDKAVSASQAQSVHSVKQAPVLAEHKVFSHRHSDLQANATHTNSASVLHRGKDRAGIPHSQNARSRQRVMQVKHTIANLEQRMHSLEQQLHNRHGAAPSNLAEQGLRQEIAGLKQMKMRQKMALKQLQRQAAREPVLARIDPDLLNHRRPPRSAREAQQLRMAMMERQRMSHGF